MAGIAAGFVGEFIGTIVFAIVVLLVVTNISSRQLFWTALCVGLGLALGVWICLLIGGPGYVNPAIAVLGGVKDGKSTLFTGSMVLAEFLAIVVVLMGYFATKHRCRNPIRFPC
jgi:hypothetical protein